MSLFPKVFLWFWLAMALVIGALFVTTELTRERPQPFQGFTGMDRAMDAFALHAAETFEREGRAGLLELFGRPGDDPHVAFYLFDGRGAELTGQETPPPIQEAARRSAATGQIVRGGPGPRMFVAHPTTTDAGRLYVLVDATGPPHGRLSNSLPALVPRVLAALLTAGALCYLLARYIVAPVVRLRDVTRQVAGGDLSARVGPLLGRRRDELGAMGRDFDAMASRIEALLSAQQRLLRDISHELRSPLARLGVAVDLLRKRTGPEAAAHLARIERESERLNEMIGQLLALSRWEAGAVGGERAALDLAALVREVVEDADFEARSRNRAVELVEGEACGLTGTPALLRSAVENVVRNAVGHAPEGTAVKVSLKCHVGRGGGEAVLSVRDEGAGVPEEALKEIFRPFYRVDDSRTRETGGTGLGLAITERAVRLHGGTVAAANIPGGGFNVEIRLPLDGGN